MTRIDKNHPKTPSEVGKITQQKRHLLQDALKNGGPEGTRTPDLLRVKQALYQLSYRSDKFLYCFSAILHYIKFISTYTTYPLYRNDYFSHFPSQQAHAQEVSTWGVVRAHSSASGPHLARTASGNL